MSQEFCEREALIISASRSGAWTPALEEHVTACTACSETKRVALRFLGHAAGEPLPANLVWQKLQARRRQQAIRRATQCMALMCVMAAVYAVVLAAWYLPQFWHAQLATDLGSLSGGFAFAGVLAAIFAVLIGSCCFAYLGSRTDFRLRS